MLCIYAHGNVLPVYQNKHILKHDNVYNNVDINKALITLSRKIHLDCHVKMICILSFGA
jgi:hypothetical protein